MKVVRVAFEALDGRRGRCRLDGAAALADILGVPGIAAQGAAAFQARHGLASKSRTVPSGPTAARSWAARTRRAWGAPVASMPRVSLGGASPLARRRLHLPLDRKSTRLNSSH